MVVIQRNLPNFPRLLRAVAMRRWTSTIGALLLALMLWTGAAGHAAERIECSPATAESTLHLDGSDEPRSGERDGKSVHFHLGCSGHCLATPSENRVLPSTGMADAAPVSRPSPWRAGDGPALTLRPPIA